MRRSVVLSVLVALMVLALPASVLAAGESEGQVIFGGSFTLHAGETLEGDLVVFGGNATIEDGAVVEGNLFLMGGNAVIGGVVERDVALFGGNLTLEATAQVGGDLSMLGGNVSREEGAVVSGQVLSGDSVRVPFNWDFGQSVQLPFGPWTLQRWPIVESIWFQGLSYILRAVLISGLAVLLVMFAPVHTSRAGRTAVEQPIISGALGLLTGLVAPIFLGILALTICLIPVTLAGAILLVVAVVFGWISLGLEIGQRMAEAFRWTIHPAAAAGLGTLLLTLIADGIGFIDCIGWLAPALVGSLGLGSVIITRFGSRLYTPAAGQAPPPPALPQA